MSPMQKDSIMSKPLTFSVARAACRALGFSLTANAAEYRLAIPGRDQEASAYYTNDLSDALGTARAWFDHIKSSHAISA
jgi:hypothetical protein